MQEKRTNPRRVSSDAVKRVTAPKQSFSIQKYILQILELQTGLSEHEIDTNESFQGSGYVFKTIVF